MMADNLFHTTFQIDLIFLAIKDRFYHFAIVDKMVTKITTNNFNIDSKIQVSLTQHAFVLV